MPELWTLQKADTTLELGLFWDNWSLAGGRREGKGWQRGNIPEENAAAAVLFQGKCISPFDFVPFLPKSPGKPHFLAPSFGSRMF